MRRVRRWIGHAQASVSAALGRLGHGCALGSDERVTVVLLSYKREHNIGRIVRSALRCRFVERVVISNNNPEVDLAPLVPSDDARVVLVQQRRRKGPSFRYDVARDHPADFYLCLDDDIFPTPAQLRRLFRALLDDPSRPVGPAGEVWDPVGSRLVYDDSRPWTLRDHTGPVDVIMHAYAFTRAHLERYFALVEAMGMVNADVRHSEDVVLSAAGDGRPLAVDLGYVRPCPTSVDPSVATWQRDGFHAFRHELYHRVQAVR